MQKFNGSLVRQFPSLITGNAAAGVTVQVFVGESGSTLQTTVVTDAAGYYSFTAPDGIYRLSFDFPNVPDQIVQLVDVDAIRNDFDAIEASNAAFLIEQQDNYDAFVLSQGWDQVGTFEAGFTYESPNQVGQDADGNWWRWNGALPKVVAAGTLTGSDANFKLVGDGVLRNDLAAADSDVLVGGVPAGDLGRKYRDYVSINDFAGSNDTERLLNGALSGEAIYIPSDRVYTINELILPAGDFTLHADKAVINTTGSFAIRRDEANYFDRITGITFTGNAIAYDYQSDFLPLPDFNQKITHHIENCRFLAATGIHKINLLGAREGFITNCYFQGNAGVRREFAINTVLNNCFWDNCDYFVLDKLGSEGLVIIGSVALGGSFGVKAERSTGVILKGNVFDFVDAPLDFSGCTDVKLLGNYISTRTASPALKTYQFADGFNGLNYEILGNAFIANNASGDTAVQLEDIYEVDFSHNQVKNFKVNGIAYGNVTQATFDNNTIRARAGFAESARSIRSLVSGDDSSVSLNNNNVTSPIERAAINPQNMWRNKGFPTENQGEAVIATGQSSVVVNHNLSVTPLKTQISLTPTTPNTKDLNYFISAITAATFTITLDTNVSDTTAFAWVIR
jgi:hypothetical protein